MSAVQPGETDDEDDGRRQPARWSTLNGVAQEMTEAIEYGTEVQFVLKLYPRDADNGGIVGQWKIPAMADKLATAAEAGERMWKLASANGCREIEHYTIDS